MRKNVTSIVAIVAVMFSFACSNAGKKDKIMSVASAFGDVSVLSNGVSKKLSQGDEIRQGDVISTGASSVIDIQLWTSGVIRILENSSVTVETMIKSAETEESKLNLDKGKVFVSVSKLSKNGKMSVGTKTMVASVRGTSYVVSSDAASSKVEVLSGKMLVAPVKDGVAVEEAATVAETHTQVTMDKKTAEAAVQTKKPVQPVVMKPEEIKAVTAVVEAQKPIEIPAAIAPEVKKELNVVLPPKEETAQKKADPDADKKARAEMAAKEKVDRDRIAADKKESERIKAQNIARETAEKERLAAEQKAREEAEKKRKQQEKESRVQNVPNI